MAQKTDLNISPYYDDFDKSKNFYKVLFKPGFPVQARELTTLQSILQNQVESFGSNIFKEGSMVLPGASTFDDQYLAVKLNEINLGVDISVYISNFVGKTITGRLSRVSATVKEVAFTKDSDIVDHTTLYVKYSQAGENSESTTFQEGEELIASENVSYGNITINSGTPFASILDEDALFTGSSVSIDNGVYFVRGTFVNVNKQSLILDYYTNNSSYRVGLKVSETIVSSKDDDSLFDNAKGFTNFAAPGADRFKIDLTLVKKPLTDFNDTDFIEILRVDDGKLKKVIDKTVYNIIRDYIAERTFDESGHYTVDEFRLNILDSLNDRIDNDGLFLENETTEEGNIPTDDLMCVQVSPGKAYVAGYDVELDATATVDVEKPRDTENIPSLNVPFEMGHLLRVNNVSGAPEESQTVELHSELGANPAASTKIGVARVYTFNLTDAAYSGASTQFDLYLYDIQTYTTLIFNRDVTTAEIPKTSFIKGKSSGASGFVVAAANSNTLKIHQTSGTFVADEQLIVNGVDASLALKSFSVFGTRDIKSVARASGNGFPQFKSDSVLSRRKIEGVDKANFVSSSGVFTSPGNFFQGIKENDIIRYQDGTSGDIRYNRVTTVGNNLTTITVAAVSPSVSGVYNGGKAGDGEYEIELAVPVLRNASNASLYAVLPDVNISSVDLSGSQLVIKKQIPVGINSTSISLNLANAGVTSAFYESFDQERYSVHYNGGGIGTVTSDAFTVTGGGTGIAITDLSASGGNSIVNVTLRKNAIQSKIKEYTRSSVNIVNLSTLSNSGVNTNTSTNDGLTSNSYYGLRVQDDEISLNVPDAVKIIAVYESTDTQDPVLDRLQFSSISQVDSSAIIGEEIIGEDSGSVARIVLNSSSTPSVPSNNIGIVYLNDEKFTVGENVKFKESSIVSTLEAITIGKYKNITNNYNLDKGQRDEYYDFSKIVRVGPQIPSRRLLIVYDHYTIPASNDGDVFTVLSYDANRFTEDIPSIGINGIRASDTLDFRPRVQNFSVTTSSPFDFDSRNFGNEPKFILKPGEGSLIGYDFYLPRVDRVYLDKFGSVIVRKGVSSIEPVPPTNEDSDMMQLAEISLPAYLYNPDDASISAIDNRRYTMRDIGDIEDRVSNLERLTSLSLLELNTESLIVEDADGNNRFKSGIFVDNFNNRSLSDNSLTNASIIGGELRPFAIRNSLQQRLVPSIEISESDLDLSENYALFDPSVQKTGNAVTLKYDSVDWINQSLATRVENVNPFHVIEYNGIIKLTPDTDTWVRTIKLPPRVVNRTVNRTENRTINRNRNVTLSNNRELSVNRVIDLNPDDFDSFRPTSAITDSTIRRNVNRSTTSNTTSSTRSSTTSRTRTVIVSSGREKYIRSRNIAFFGNLFRPLERHYQFFDKHSNLSFIPKLIEISPNPNDDELVLFGSSNNSFQTGETVIVYSKGDRIGTFRLAKSNHKTGKFNSPETTYSSNPYKQSESIPDEYSQSSKTINIDLNALSAEAQGSFNGYIEKGAKIVGQTSGAIAYVKDVRLVADTNGSIFGSFFIKNPHIDPAPNPRILTGKKTYRLTSSKENETPLPGSTKISAGDSTYTANGTFRRTQQVTTRTTTRTRTNVTTNVNTNTTTLTNIITRTNTRARRVDPLAQSFTVGRDIDAPDFSGDNDDDNGVFLTELDIFVASKPSGNEPLTVEIRTVELGTPTLNILGEPKTLLPSQISTSDKATEATRVVFDYPIFLAPGQEYAVVLLAPNTDQYEVWTAKMGESTIETQSLAKSESIRYSKQFALGSLFKSQNGSIWTPAQESDLKFKLYKAKFTETTGIAHFGNPPLDSSNGYVPTLQENCITVLPKEITLGIDKIAANNTGLISNLSPGRKIKGAIGNSFGIINSVGSVVSGISTTNSGTNYKSGSNFATTNVFGKGSGLTLNIIATDGVITNAAISNSGNGYKVGDIVTIVNGANETGRNAILTVNEIDGIDTLYLTNVQGEVGAGKAFDTGGTQDLAYFNADSSVVSLGSTHINNRSEEDTGLFSGDYLQVQHFNHGMYATNNKLKLSDIESNIAPETLTANLSATVGASGFIEVSDSSVFQVFEGQGVNVSNLGYAKIGDEIVGYSSAISNKLTINSRGVEGVVQDHSVNDEITKYEFSGISLRRINNIVYDIADLTTQDIIGSDSYFIKIDKGQTSTIEGKTISGVNRSSDTGSTPQLSFASGLIGGGNDVKSTENIIFNRINPRFNVISPGRQTSISADIRTTTGTSIDGNEVSFTLENKIEPVILNQVNDLNSVRIVCSRVNELNQTQFDNVVGRRSFNSTVTFNTTNENLSPMLFIDDSAVEFISDDINSPITNYTTDSRTNSIANDPHEAVYVSNVIGLAQPASSLKVILTAYRPEASDIRVLYGLVREDSVGVEQEFELFPGFDNLESSSDGTLKVVDSSLNDGRPDIRVPASERNQYLEYEFTANDLEDFSGYRIKIVMSSTSQANYPIIRDLRTIALK